MFEKLKLKKNSGILLLIKRNTEIVALGILILLTIQEPMKTWKLLRV